MNTADFINSFPSLNAQILPNHFEENKQAFLIDPNAALAKEDNSVLTWRCPFETGPTPPGGCNSRMAMQAALGGDFEEINSSTS